MNERRGRESGDRPNQHETKWRGFNQRDGCWVAGVLLAVVLASSGTAVGQNLSPGGTDYGAGRDLGDFIRRYSTDNEEVERFYNLPWSESRFDRMERLNREWAVNLAAVDFDGLNLAGRIDYLLLRNELAHAERQLALRRRWLAEMDALLPIRREVLEIITEQRNMVAVDPEVVATRISKFGDALKRVRERIQAGKEAAAKAGQPASASAPSTAATGPSSAPAIEPLAVSPVVAKRASGAIDALRGSLREWYGFYDGYKPEFSWWLKKPYEDAQKALDEYAKYLREEIAGIKGKDEDPLIGEAIGRDALLADLQNEMVPYSPEELIAIGEREFAWCESEMKRAAADMGLGEDWKAALRKVKAGHVPPGKQDELVTEQSRFVIQFLKDRDLVTVPPLCEELWRLTMISPEVQKVLPFAAYGGQNMMVAYPTDDMKHEDKLMSMRGNNRHFSRIVTPHELIPGHHLQAFMAERERPYRRMFGTPFFVEGWALHWEMLLWDLGYPQSPEDRIGMLFWRMHRCARIIVSLKFHLGQMTPPEMVDFLVERVGHEKFGATSEVRRYIGSDYSPLYQCGYMLGGLQIRALHKELVGGGKMTNRQFHDALLTYGPIAVELVRAGLLNLPLTRETEAGWRFGDTASDKVTK